jgi:hypothetical protein
MPARPKFTEETRTKLLEVLAIGASRRTACAVAGVDPATLRRWLARGATASEGSRWREFAVDLGKAEASGRIRALRIVHDALPDRPDLAWKFIERREEGYARPLMPEPPAMPTIIQLEFADARWPLPVEGVTGAPHTGPQTDKDDGPAG